MHACLLQSRENVLPNFWHFLHFQFVRGLDKEELEMYTELKQQRDEEERLQELLQELVWGAQHRVRQTEKNRLSTWNKGVRIRSNKSKASKADRGTQLGWNVQFRFCWPVRQQDCLEVQEKTFQHKSKTMKSLKDLQASHATAMGRFDKSTRTWSMSLISPKSNRLQLQLIKMTTFRAVKPEIRSERSAFGNNAKPPVHRVFNVTDFNRRKQRQVWKAKAEG